MRRRGTPHLARACGAAMVIGAFMAACGLLVAPPTARVRPVHSTGDRTFLFDSAADFAQPCIVQNGTSVGSADGGEIRLAAGTEDYFDDGALDATQWISGYSRSFHTTTLPFESDGWVNLNGTWLRTVVSDAEPARFFEARALLRTGDAETGWPDLGFIREGQWVGEAFEPAEPKADDTASRLFLANDGSQLLSWGRDGDGANPLLILTHTAFAGDVLRLPHVFRIEWTPETTRFYLNGERLPGSMPGTTGRRSWIWLYSLVAGRPVQVDWVRAGQYDPAGMYSSCPIDAAGTFVWRTLSAIQTAPNDTSVAFQTRTSNDAANWTAWADLDGIAIQSPPGRYLQYRVLLNTDDILRSPQVEQVVIVAGPPPSTPTATPAPTATATATPAPTATATPTATPTAMATATPAPTATATPTAMPTAMATATPAPTATATPGIGSRNRIFLPLVMTGR